MPRAVTLHALSLVLVSAALPPSQACVDRMQRPSTLDDVGVRLGGEWLSKVRHRTTLEGYLSQFSVVDWPPEQAGFLYAGDGVTRVVDFKGRTRVRLSTPDSSSLMDAHGVPVRFGTDDFLVATLSMSNWDRTQLIVFDRSGTLRFREVVRGSCKAVAAPEPDAFLFGCGPNVRRYSLRR